MEGIYQINTLIAYIIDKIKLTTVICKHLQVMVDVDMTNMDAMPERSL